MTRFSDYVAAVLADSPAAYFELNDASGFPQDSSGNGRHITGERNGTGSSTTYGRGGPADGSSLSIVSQRHTFITSAPVLSVSDNFTLEAWIGNASNGGGTPGNVFMYNGRETNEGAPAGTTPNGYGLSLVATTFFLGIDISNSGGSAGSGTNPSNGTHACFGANSIRGVTGVGSASTRWSHVLLIRRSGVWEYWVDGVSEIPANNSTTPPAGPPAAESHIFCGNFTSIITYQLAHVAFYPTPLSSTRILAHYNVMAAAVNADYPFFTLPIGHQNPASGRVRLL